MKTLTEIAFECGALLLPSTKKIIINVEQLQAFVDAVNAQNSEAVYIVGTGWQCDEMLPVGTELYTAPQADQSAYIKRLEAQIKRLTNATESVLAVVESSLYLDDEELHNLQNKLEQALASKESMDG